jgi:hypothetical protein
MVTRRRPDFDKGTVWLIRQPHGFIPATQFDSEELERYKIGQTVMATIESPKSQSTQKLERLYRGLLGKIGKATGTDPESLHWMIRLKAGAYLEAQSWEGGMWLRPKSTRDMDDAEFSAFYERAWEIITTQIVPGATVEEILKETYPYIGLKSEPVD